jgi:hypothetical protein
MSKKLFILLIVCVGVIVVAAAYVYTRRQRPQPVVAPPSITPLVVLSTSPTDQASHNPFLPVVVTFNRAPHENEVSVSVVPSTKTTSATEGNTITITPQTTFLPESHYTVSLNTIHPYTFSFVTQTDIENDPRSNGIFKKVNQQYLQQNTAQEAALTDIRKNAPIKENGFTVNFSYADDTYTIVLLPPYYQNKSAFLNWLQQRGVTNLTNLRINYINQ